jgi:phosphopantothenoylcysteine decarboxylase / phosphopantothenate---cysteine ligase
MARILLGVSGGIAAYKALELVRLATAAGHAVRVIQTPASRRFVGAASFAALTGAPVLASEFERDPARGSFPGQLPPAHEPLSHLALVENAEVYLIAPASANTIAKLAHGLADNLLSSCALAAGCPVLLAPAMNNRMYEHPATRANLNALRERGVSIIEPGAGPLASKGEEGVGRLAEPARLLAACEAALSGPSPHGSGGPPDGVAAAARDQSWRGVRVLVTAGGTREPIDSVRFLGNSSSGRMGFALARAARARGAEVTLLAANVALEQPPGVACRQVVTAAELEQACEEEFPSCDVLLMAAAVADFRPAAPTDGKIKKSGRARLELELEPTTDVLASLARRRRDGQTLVGFAAEYGDRAVEAGREKLTAKGLDAVVVNDISRPDIGFDVDSNEVTILTSNGGASGAGGPPPPPPAKPLAGVSPGEAAAPGSGPADPGPGDLHLARARKREIAEAILDAVERLRAGR